MSFVVLSDLCLTFFSWSKYSPHHMSLNHRQSANYWWSQFILSRVLVSIVGVWTSNWIYWSRTSLSTSNYNNFADSHTILSFLNVISLVFIIRFLATDLSQSLCSYSTCKFCNSLTNPSWRHSLIPSTADSLNFDLKFRLFWLSSWQLTVWHVLFWLSTPLELFWLRNELSVQSQSQIYITTDGQSASVKHPSEAYD
jgi:hypothetical protein